MIPLRNRVLTVFITFSSDNRISLFSQQRMKTSDTLYVGERSILSTSTIEGVLGTQPIMYSIADVTSTDGDANLFPSFG